MANNLFLKSLANMEYGQIIIGSAISIVSAAFGWFSNQIAEYWTDRKVRNRKLKSLLAHLLEIYQLMVKSDVGRFTDRIANKVFKQVKGDPIAFETKKQIRTYYEQLGNTLFNPLRTKELEKIKAGYEKSLIDLSEIDPVRCYWLRGRDEIFERLEMINQFIEDAKAQAPSEFQQIDPYIDSIINSTKKNLIKEAIKDLEDEIIEIANLISQKQRKEIILTLDRIKYIRDKEIDKMIKELFSKLEKELNSK